MKQKLLILFSVFLVINGWGKSIYTKGFGNSTNAAPNTIITWTGLSSSLWSNAGNWSTNTVPTQTDDVVIPSGTPFSPNITGTTSTLVNNLTINSGATLSNDALGAFLIFGNFTNNGTLITSTNGSFTSDLGGNLINNGTITGADINFPDFGVPLTISGTGTIDKLIIGSNAGVTINGGVTTIINALTLKLGTLTTGNRLILASSSGSTANVARIDGSVNTGSISGSVMVQRFIPANNRKKYVLVSSPVGSPSINGAWQEAGATIAGYGTHITNASTANGFDGPVTSSASIFTYDDSKIAGTKWTALTNTNSNTLSPGKGYLLFVRGDRSENRPVTGNSSNTILRAIGTIRIGNVTFSTTGGTAGTPALLGGNGKYTLIANPYASVINWNNKLTGSTRDITLTDVADVFYVYDPKLGVFATYDNGSGLTSPSNSAQGKYIQSGQAFFVQATSAAPAITFTENAKTNVSTAVVSGVFGTDVARPKLNVNIYRTTDNVFADGVVAVFDNKFKAGIALEDASKFTNFNETFALLRDGNTLSIEGRPTVTGNDTLHFALTNFGKRDYTLVIDASNFSNTSATLEDKYTTIKQAIDLTANNSYKFTVNDDAASVANDRFIITFGSTVKLTTDVATDNNLFVKMSPNPVSNQLQVSFKTAEVNQTTINIVNSLGQIVRTVNAGKVDAGTISIPVTTLVSGLYTVQLLSGDKQINSQKVVKE